jgi:NAD(P)-dependent dehydrogenase (short-subunit alcohol dehydrogenase family)
VAVVTGAANGIGNALARRAGAEGMKVVLVDIDEARLKEAVADLQESGVDATGIGTDVADHEQVTAMAESVYATHGAVHLLCSNAGIASLGLPWETSIADWRRIIDVNLFGSVHAVHAFVGRMLEQGDPAHIVITASMAGLTSSPIISAYSTSKHALTGFSECLAGSLLGTNVAVSVLCPGRVATTIGNDDEAALIDQIDVPLNRAVTPEHVADTVFDGVRSNKGYLFTHAESLDALRERVDAIVGVAHGST